MKILFKLCHCEKRSDEAIFFCNQSNRLPRSRWSLAMTLICYLAIVLLFILGTNQNVSAENVRSQITSQFVQAGNNYRDGNYKQAILHYENILSEGFESGTIYYNLANSYFKNHQLGQSILNYERASRLLPRDSDVKFNYQYAFAQIPKPIQQPSMNFLQKAIDGHIHFYTKEEMIGICVSLVVMMGILFLMALYRKWSSAIRLSILGGLSVILIVYSVGFIFKVQYEQNLSIILSSTEAKFEPRSNTTTHYSLPMGSKVYFIKQQKGWVKVKRLDGKLGWIEKKDIEKI